MDAPSRHIPVMREQVLFGLAVKPDGLYLDATCDGAGHAQAILEAGAPACRLVGLDMDAAMLEFATRRLDPYGARVKLVHANFASLGELVSELAPEGFDGILADLGFSSNQIDDAARGLAFSKPGPLDMRLDASCGESAAELIARLEERELREIIEDYGEERFARVIARGIKARLLEGPFAHTGELADTIARAVPRRFHPPHTHVATRTFQALRIAVNDEMGNLDRFLPAALAALKIGGRLAILSYHSLEDRRVRRAFQKWERPCECPPNLPICACGKKPQIRVITRKAIEADETERTENPRARSAHLRVCERIAP